MEEEEEEEEYTEDEDTEDLTTSTIPSIACEAVGNYTALVSHYKVIITLIHLSISP